jgi:hypothetical protein
MAVRLTKPFTPFSAAEVEKLPGHMGVFELADAGGEVVYIGYAGGRSLFGLRGELGALLNVSGASQFRTEVNTAYLTRYQELLMAFMADHGRLPAENDADKTPRLGRLSPG